MQYVLETKGLCKQYKNFQALDDLNMHVPKGAIYGFVGKNGAGKTTLIQVITGLQYPTAGGYSLYGIMDTDKQIRKSRRRMGAGNPGSVETRWIRVYRKEKSEGFFAWYASETWHCHCACRKSGFPGAG